MSLLDALEAYQKAKVEKDLANQELYQIRECFEENKVRIDRLEKDFSLEKDARTLADSRHVLALEQQDVLVSNNVCLNRLIENVYSTMNQIEHNQNITNNFQYPSSKRGGIGTKNHTPLEELKKECENFKGDNPKLEYDKKCIFILDLEGVLVFNEFQNECFVPRIFDIPYEVTENISSSKSHNYIIDDQVTCNITGLIPNNYVIEEIIPGTSGHASDQSIEIGGIIWR